MLFSTIPWPVDLPMGGGGKNSALYSSLKNFYFSISYEGLTLVPIED
jgi:hypothetical protein